MKSLTLIFCPATIKEIKRAESLILKRIRPESLEAEARIELANTGFANRYRPLKHGLYEIFARLLPFSH